MTKTELLRALEAVGWEEEIYLYNGQDGGDLYPVHKVEFVNCVVYRSGAGQRITTAYPINVPEGLKVPVIFDSLDYDEVFRWSPPPNNDGHDPNEYTGGE